MGNFRQASKDHNWTSSDSTEHINAGSLQRIADATEMMAKNYVNMQQERDNYQKWYRERGLRIDELQRSKASLRGQITKLKKALAAAQSATKGVIIVDGILND